MNIVRIALIVLAMVFSATPLPFNTITTQTFLNFWWCGVRARLPRCLGLLPCRPRSRLLSLHRALTQNSPTQNS